jgi:homoaconitase/3-isopropylmalate dehydratase large subunit
VRCCFGIKVWDQEKIVIIPDHYIFTSDERANRNVDILRDFCMEQNIKYFYDIKDLGNFKVRLFSHLYFPFANLFSLRAYILFSGY